MAELRYLAMTSLDGHTADDASPFDCAAPGEWVHQFVNDAFRDVGAYLYGRRMYETMQYWEAASTGDDVPAVAADWAGLWQAAEKVVYSRTLTEPSTARTRLVREFDADEIRRLKADADRDLGIGGPGLAAEALRAGLVDQLDQLVNPVVVGGGRPWLPAGLHQALRLVDERRFGDVVHLRYRLH